MPISAQEKPTLPDPLTGEELSVYPDTFNYSAPYAGALDPMGYLRHAPRDRYPSGSFKGLYPQVLGRKLRGFAQSPRSGLADAGPFGGALWGIPMGLGGATLGYILGKALNRDGLGKKMGILGALLGSGAGGLAGYIRMRHKYGDNSGLPATISTMPEKKAFYRMPGGEQGPRKELLQMLMQDPAADMQMKASLADKISMLSGMQASELLRLVAAVGTGSVAALLARKLLGSSYLSSALIGLGSGTLLNSLMQPRDALGRTSHSGRDMYGNPIMRL